ncbi:MarR family transcriptional regulator [Alisedimentitalea sp. MJ-SS2]|uniref:MarR family winged helix-turn-helix transcriptional regulator n=1 Tax=Aliisedimentitalea sp. MJ-SS2 TaxID=3049795 RepID=UPI0029061ABF|nr:MarR family transcriptional regulator [Alisedimentitalea sp. MJ-SS2]MDU8927121.1 MarR family transcriptional regulator [Alisedimentitalea sp. MJ-SS2]
MSANPAPKPGIYDVPLRQMLTYRLTRLNAKMNAQAIRVLGENGGLSQTQWRVLVLIDYLGPTTPARVGREIVMDKGQLSRAIKTMSARGLIRVEASESDHRAHIVSMTDEGREMFERARPAMRQRQLDFSEGLTAQEREVLFRAMDKLEQLAER